jgi:hypothetical protein
MVQVSCEKRRGMNRLAFLPSLVSPVGLTDHHKLWKKVKNSAYGKRQAKVISLVKNDQVLEKLYKKVVVCIRQQSYSLALNTCRAVLEGGLDCLEVCTCFYPG